jgi:DNA polymerase
MEFKKEFIETKCACPFCSFYKDCALLQTEVVKSRDEDTIDIMFVGQGAGEKEHLTHHPFTGPAGRVLRVKLLPRLEAKKLNIILDNTIRSRPLDEKNKNRAPTADEVANCLPILWQRIGAYKPSIIVPLGASAAGDCVPSLNGKKISAVRGKIYSYKGYKFLPTFHPAAILHCGEQDTISMYHAKIDEDLDLAIKETGGQLRLI